MIFPRFERFEPSLKIGGSPRGHWMRSGLLELARRAAWTPARGSPPGPVDRVVSPDIGVFESDAAFELAPGTMWRTPSGSVRYEPVEKGKSC